MKALLSDLRVLDLSRVLAGPWAAQTLGDFGAEVIKIERPGIGDDARRYGPPFRNGEEGAKKGESSFFLSANRNKKSIAIDLSRPEGAELVRKLAAHSDILIENYRVGDLARYGLDYESVRHVAPRLIYCSVTGFGQTGPYRFRPGYDSVFQAMSGLMSVTGHADDQPGGGPMKMGPSITDILGGSVAMGAILAALYERDAKGGGGRHIDVAMLDVVVSAMSHHAMYYLISGKQPPRRGTEGHGGAGGKMYQCRNGRVMVTIGNDAQFVRFCEMLGRPDLGADPRFITNEARTVNCAEFIRLIDPVVAELTAEEFLDRLEKSEIPGGPVHELKDVFSDPHLRERGLEISVPHDAAGPLRMVGNPARFSDTALEYQAPPALGAHTREVLEHVLRLDAAAIDALVREKVVAGA